MTSSLTLRWLLTAAFAVLGGYCLLRCAIPALTRPAHTLVDVASDAAHLAMSAAMIAMLWALTRGDRWGAQPAVFAVAALWYLVRAVDSRHPRRYRIGLVHQGVAMAAMLWMYLAMTATPAASAVSGMDMGGMTMASTARHTALLSTTHAITIALAAYLAVATIWWLRSTFGAVTTAPATVTGGVLAAGHACATGRTGMRIVFGPAGDAGCQMLMAAAMCVVLLASI